MENSKQSNFSFKQSTSSQASQEEEEKPRKKRFQADEYLSAAKKCAEVIWYRGLLKKGYGLCHGISGKDFGF